MQPFSLSKSSHLQTTDEWYLRGESIHELLGEREAGENETLAHLPKTEAGKPGRAPENLQPDVSEATLSAAKH